MDYSKNTPRYTPNRQPVISMAQSVRLLDADGSTIGVVTFREAQDIARERNLDLMEIVGDARPPVYKIGDASRLNYEQQKRQRELRKNQKNLGLKEVQLRPGIQKHDYDVKKNNAIEFLKEKNKVKISLQFRGREIAFADAGRVLVGRFIDDLAPWGKAESFPKLEGRKIIVMVSPVKDLSAEGEPLGTTGAPGSK